MPAASTATSVTSARPIISAAAVDAVRCGLRRAFSRASVPATPPNRDEGQPSHAASGVTSRSASKATPRKIRNAPSPIHTRRAVVLNPGPKRLHVRAAKPTSVTRIETGTRKRANRDFGSSAPSRTAAIGGTRVARNAGRTLATSVTRMPAARAMTTAVGSRIRPLFGSVKPTASKSQNSAFASPTPAASPTSDAITPTTRAWSRIEVRIWRREPPIVRTVANSRVRWAIVIESELAITKLPTKSAIPPNARRKPRRNEMKLFVSAASSWTCWVAVFTCAVGGSSARRSRTSSWSETPGFAATAISSSRPRFPKIRWAVGRSKPASVAPPIVETDPNRTRPEIRSRRAAPSAWTPNRFAESQVLLLRRRLVHDELAVLRPGAADKRKRIEGRIAGRDAETEVRSAPVHDRLAVVADELRLPVNTPLGFRDRRKLLHPGQ